MQGWFNTWHKVYKYHMTLSESFWNKTLQPCLYHNGTSHSKKINHLWIYGIHFLVAKRNLSSLLQLYLPDHKSHGGDSISWPPHPLALDLFTVSLHSPNNRWSSLPLYGAQIVNWSVFFQITYLNFYLNLSGADELIHCGLVMQCRNIELGQPHDWLK